MLFLFEYKALDSKGRPVEGVVKARSMEKAKEHIRNAGKFVCEIKFSEYESPEYEEPNRIKDEITQDEITQDEITQDEAKVLLAILRYMGQENWSDEWPHEVQYRENFMSDLKMKLTKKADLDLYLNMLEN